MTELSIIVIIYKVEKYLRQCLNSILAQTYENYELILIDDGSPDRCPQICDEYAAKDKRITVVHQQNQGSVRARWNGILRSNGKYISLLDSDDWLEPDMYKRVMDLAIRNNADMVAVGYKEERGEETKTKGNRIHSGVYATDRIEEIYRRALYDDAFYEPGIIPAVWNKLIRRELFFYQYNPADSAIRMGEDAAFIYPMIARAKSVVIDNEFCPYHYRVIEGSMSNSYDSDYFSKAEKLLKGLQSNCACNPEMTLKLTYYGLFISQIGIYRLFSRNCKYGLKKKLRILTEYMQGYKSLKFGTLVDWTGFGQDSRCLMKAFMDCDSYGVLRSVYRIKVKEKWTGIRRK